MRKTVLGKTGLEVTRVGFGVLPLQRVSMDEAKRILTRAYESGINFYDTARHIPTVRKNRQCAVGCKGKHYYRHENPGKGRENFWRDLETSLEKLKTDYIDIYQFHNPEKVPMAGDELYEAMLQAKQKGLIRHIGITNHSFENGKKAILSGLYETLQYPFNHISSEEDLELVMLCKEKTLVLSL